MNKLSGWLLVGFLTSAALITSQGAKGQTYQVLYNFNGGADGANPFAAGNLYGTTSEGGASGYGTLFKLSPSGKFTLLHSFTGRADGGSPSWGLGPIMDASGDLYGTTVNGGTYGQGTIFKFGPNGPEDALYSFSGGADGGSPYGGLIRDAFGNLYGTTSYGGAYGTGVVFELSPRS